VDPDCYWALPCAIGPGCLSAEERQSYTPSGISRTTAAQAFFDFVKAGLKTTDS